MIPCISRLVPANGQSFALLEDIYFAGGFRTLASVEEMQNTHVSARKAGMHVFVPGVGYFKLADDLITWLPDPFAKALTAGDLYAMLEPMYIRQRLSRSADDPKVFLATRVFHSEAMVFQGKSIQFRDEDYTQTVVGQKSVFTFKEPVEEDMAITVYGFVKPIGA